MLAVISWIPEVVLASQALEYLKIPQDSLRNYDRIVMEISPFKEISVSFNPRDRDVLRNIYDRARKHSGDSRGDVYLKLMIHRIADYIAQNPSPIEYVRYVLACSENLAEYTMIDSIVRYAQEKRRKHYNASAIPDDDEELHGKTKSLLAHMKTQILAKRAVEPRDYLRRENGHSFCYDAMVYLFSEHDKGVFAVQRRFCMMLAVAVEERKLAEVVEDREQAVANAQKKAAEGAAERGLAAIDAKKKLKTARELRRLKVVGTREQLAAAVKERKRAVADEKRSRAAAAKERWRAVADEKRKLKEAVEERDNDLRMFDTIVNLVKTLKSAKFIRNIEKYEFQRLVLEVLTSKQDLRAVKFLDAIGLSANASLVVLQYITSGQRANVSPCFVLLYTQYALDSGVKDGIWAESILFKYFTEAGMTARLSWLYHRPEILLRMSERVLCHVLYYVWKEPELGLASYIDEELKDVDKELFLRTLTRSLSADYGPEFHAVLLKHCPSNIKIAWDAYVSELRAESSTRMDAAGKDNLSE
ncbi:hypothetical protein PAPHI01_1944 [Pancytospora philotis]|nr:hypothetical protein PAPHI01_1944 [Pancytospora philotis]